MKLQKLLIIAASATAFMACIGCSNKTYTVTFETDGGTKIEDVKVSGKLEKPEDPVKRPYVFGGWYSNERLTTEFDFSKPITEDTTLYAKWNESVQFTYVYHEGTGEGEDIIQFTIDYLHYDEVSSKYYGLVIDWGDGDIDNITPDRDDPSALIITRELAHSYDDDKKEYKITINGLVNSIYFNDLSNSLNARGFPAGNCYIKSMSINQLIYHNIDYHAQLGADYSPEIRSQLTDVTLPSDLTYIADFTFTYSAITKYAISDKITRIGRAAFADSAIKTIDFSNAKSLYTISSAAFAECSNLGNIVFPENLTSISDEAFYNCPKLSTVTFTSYMPPFVDEDAFVVTPTSNAPVEGLNKVYVPKGRKSAYVKAWTATNPELVSIIEEL